jgi:NAD(P)-dependent dehydrogenase (short-subunit alcohol dehydrogenase family)
MVTHSKITSRKGGEMSNQYDFGGKYGIITGAASGIGRAAALLLARSGAKLSLVDINGDGLKKVVAEIQKGEGPKPLAIVADVSKESDVVRMVSETLSQFGVIDFLITSAGILFRTAFMDITISEWDELMGTNLRGLFLCCREVVKSMIQKGKGVIVNVASVAGRSTSLIGGAHYATSKHGVIGLSRHMARELTPHGIRINAFCPGATLTPMVLDTTTQGERDEIANRIPIRRLANPEEQAQVIAFMLSDASSYLTGACVDSNGGSFMV